MIARTTIDEHVPDGREGRWSIRKGGTQLDCMLTVHGRVGVELHLSSPGKWSSVRRCASREAAIAEADALKAKLLLEGGVLL
jgi:hypothetical protein